MKLCYNYNGEDMEKVVAKDYDENISAFGLYLIIDKKYSHNTMMSYKEDLNLICLYLKKESQYITHDDILRYLDFLKSEDIKSKTVARKLSTFKSFYKFLLIEQKITESPVDKIELPKIEKKLPKVLTIEEIDLLLDIEAQDSFSSRNKAMLELMYATGLRVSELVNLTINDIDLNNDIVRTIGKGNKERIIPIGDYAKDALIDYINFWRSSMLKNNICDKLFLNNHGKELTRQGFFKILKNSPILKKRNVFMQYISI